MNFKFLSTAWNCLFIAIMVILIIAIIAKKLASLPKKQVKQCSISSWYRDNQETIDNCVNVLRWILALCMGTIGYLITGSADAFWFYFCLLIGLPIGFDTCDFGAGFKIAIVLQMIALGIFVLVTVSWKLALIFIPLALVGYILVPLDED